MNSRLNFTAWKKRKIRKLTAQYLKTEKLNQPTTNMFILEFENEESLWNVVSKS